MTESFSCLVLMFMIFMMGCVTENTSWILILTSQVLRTILIIIILQKSLMTYQIPSVSFWLHSFLPDIHDIKKIQVKCRLVETGEGQLWMNFSLHSVDMN
jgi:hypothetical protein